MKLLVADDDSLSRQLIRRTLELVGYDVVEAEDGSAALRELSDPLGPRLAVMDWMMPGIDGPDVCRAIRAIHGRSYIYTTLLTSRQSPQDIVAGLQAGADDYLTKPCNPEELKARLRSGQRILRLEDELVNAREEMRFKATHDELTALWNRGAILTLLQAELQRSLREPSPVSLLLCDVDHFKRINDTYGHLTGDDILRQVSQRLLHAVRPYDLVGRYGGEEFLLVLKNCDSSQIGKRADQVREAVVSEKFVTAGGPLSASVSIGALAVHHWGGQSTIESLLGRIDLALYGAKSEGRNRVVHAAASPVGVGAC